MLLKKIWSEKSENRAYLPPIFPLLKILYIVSQSIAGSIQDWRDWGAQGQRRVSCHLSLPLLLWLSGARAGPNPPPHAVCCPMAASWGAWCCPLAGRQEPAWGLQLSPCQGGIKGTHGQPDPGCSPGRRGDCARPPQGAGRAWGTQGVGGQGQPLGMAVGHWRAAGWGVLRGCGCWAWPPWVTRQQDPLQKGGALLAKGVPAAGPSDTASPSGTASPTTTVHPSLPTTLGTTARLSCPRTSRPPHSQLQKPCWGAATSLPVPPVT